MPNGFSSKILGLFTGFPTGVEDMERGEGGGGSSSKFDVGGASFLSGGCGVPQGGCFEGF